MLDILVRVNHLEFGEKENADLAAELGVPDKSQWPIIFVFKRNPHRWIAKYNGRFNLNYLRNFVNQHSEVDWSCAGCVLEMDRLVRSHLFEHHISANEMVRSAQDTLAKTASRDLGKRNTMQYYVKMMKKINEIGQPAVAMESARLVRLLQQKLSPEKEKLFKVRTDILYFSFSGNLWRYQEEEEEETATSSDLMANLSTKNDNTRDEL
ncbi:uncharacterized protein LOC111266615 [Varroa jacobsoni]|uniref:uncharacterized protein LOC111266615 n=1 Tax=Varroa jacobsoni TaxID=62625 RepID=UPI000BF3354E|nr:uncharacterized protein LOC111266615 [Varroa jacobsoni]